MRQSYLALWAMLTLILGGCSQGDGEPDMPGQPSSPDEYQYLAFNKWIYSQMNRQYLWREDMPDSLDCDYELFPKEFFQSLLSPKDRFSYFTSNPYYSSRGGGNCGFAYQAVRDRAGREALQVLYVTAPSARRAGLRRGDLVEIISEGSAFVSLRRLTENDGLIAATADKVEFTIDDPSGPASTVLLDSVYNIADRKIGYICYLEYGERKDIEPSFKKFKEAGINDLILDLRYNPGGYVSTSKYVCNCIVSEAGYGNTFQLLSYNDILTAYYLSSGKEDEFNTFFTFPTPDSSNTIGARVIGLDMERIFIITSRNTASASEATIICLQPYMEVITVGETTVGKGVGSWTIYDSKYPYALQPITMRYYNADGETVTDDGIEPTVFVPDGYNTPRKEIGDLTEPLLAETMALIAPGFEGTILRIGAKARFTALTPVGEPSFVTEFRNKPISRLSAGAMQ